MELAGCPLCRLSSKAEAAYIASLSYERVLDLNTRDILKASRGLCAHHSRVWQHLQGSALGIAIVYRVSVLDLLRDTDPDRAPDRSPFRRRSPAGAAAARLASSGPCPACEVGSAAATRFGEVLLEGIMAPEMGRLLTTCGGLCLPHLREVLRLPQAAPAYDALMRSQREAWQRLVGELEEFIRKNDYRFAGEPMSDAEALSWTRALDALVGLEDTEPGR